MKLSIALLTAGWIATGLPALSFAGDEQREAEVRERGADVMPFNLKDTLHTFTKTQTGGTQRVVARDASNAQQVTLVRRHLREIQQQFLHGNFSGPEHIHGAEMPGLAELKAAKPGQIAIDYRDVPGGGELTYKTSDARLQSALHAWFDAQLSDHGADAMEGHQHHH